MRTKLCALAALALVATAATAGSAAADPDNSNSVEVTINCPGQTFTGDTIDHNNAVVFQVSGEHFVAITQDISYVDPDTGQTVFVRTNPGQGHDLTTCTYMYPGFPVLVTGEFQFSGNA